MTEQPTLRRIGVFGKPTGYKGDITLLSDGVVDVTADMFVFVDEDGLPVPWHVTDVRAKGDDYVVHIKDTDSDTSAAAFTGSEVFVTDEYAASHGSDDNGSDLLYTDLIGYSLYDGDARIGEIADVDDSTYNVVFEVVSDSGKSILVPAADDFIDEIDTIDKKIIMSLPSGLTELN